MKNFPFLLLAVCFAATSTVFGQITVQQNQLHPIFVVGDSINMLISNDTTIDVGNKGGPNVYDFSRLNYMSVEGGVETGSSIPITASDFSNDTILTNPGGYEVEYFSGNEMISPGKVNISSDTSYSLSVRVPGEVLFSFPLSYGKSWTYTFTSYDTTFIKGVPKSGASVTDTRMTTVDGYGTLKLPGGVSVQCLRLLQESQSSQDGSDLTFFYVTSVGTFLVVNSTFGQPDTGSVGSTGVQVIEGTLPTAVRSNPQAAAGFALDQNYPNPFNPSTMINYQLAMNSRVTLKVYDILGREVRTLVDGMLTAGNHSVVFDGRSLPSGVYFYTMHAGNYMATRKLLLMK